MTWADGRLLVSPILESPTPFLIRNGALRLIENTGADLRDLTRQILAGEYAKPFVIDDGRTRSLHFTLAHVQSAMRIDAPYALQLAYTRKMMAFRRFLPAPRHILAIGLGGGSLAKYCYRHLPHTRITSVESDRDVIAFRELFAIPLDDQRFEVVHADAASYLAGNTEQVDTILLDAYDASGITPRFRNLTFYASLSRHLSDGGMLVANLSGDPANCQAHLALLRHAFENRLLVLDVAGVRNRIAFAFKGHHPGSHFDLLPDGQPN